MNKYIVYVLELHQIQIEVDAVSEGDAIEQAVNGNGTWLDKSMEFVDCADTDTWTVELVELDKNMSNREQYLYEKIDLCKDQIAKLGRSEPNNTKSLDLVKSGLKELEEELELINSDDWKSITSQSEEPLSGE